MLSKLNNWNVGTSMNSFKLIEEFLISTELHKQQYGLHKYENSQSEIMRAWAQNIAQTP